MQTPLSVSAGPDTDLTLCEIFWFVRYPWGNFTDETLHALFDMECFHSRGQYLCKFIDSKESVCIRKEFNSHRIGLGHQHGRRFIVWHILHYCKYWLVCSTGHFRVPKPSLSKWGQLRNLSCENEFNLHENEQSFPYQRLSTWPRFHKEAQGNSEMAY